MGYIPYSEITGWLDENYIDEVEERILFRRLITFIDSVYVAKESERSKTKGNKK